MLDAMTTKTVSPFLKMTNAYLIKRFMKKKSLEFYEALKISQYKYSDHLAKTLSLGSIMMD